MDSVLAHLTNAHQAAKDTAIAALQNDSELDQSILDTIKAIYALIQAVKTSMGQ